MNPLINLSPSKQIVRNLPYEFRNNKIFYKSRLICYDDNYEIYTEVYLSIKETQHMHWCINEAFFNLVDPKYTHKEMFEILKERKALTRILKSGSRIAFETREKALSHLKFLKSKHLGHLVRTMNSIKVFLSDNVSIDDIDKKEEPKFAMFGDFYD